MPHSPKRALRFGAIVLCVVAVTVLVANTGADLWHHHDSPNSAPCQICHTVHLPIVSATVAIQLPVPVISSWTAPPVSPAKASVSITRQSPPRAPPVFA